MQKFLKEKGFVHGSSSTQYHSSDDIFIHSGQPKGITRNPNWQEDHNIVIGDMLLEQYIHGNFCKGNLRNE